MGEIEKLDAEPPDEQRLARARKQVRGSVMRGWHSVHGRMVHLGSDYLETGSTQSIEELLASYDAVTPEQVKKIAHDVSSANWSLSYIAGEEQSVEI